MFTGWRHAVETLAQPVKPAGSPEAAASGEDAPVRSSLDSLAIRTSISSPAHLAESALSNLRKTLVAQRPASPANAANGNAQASTSSPEPAPTPATKPRSGTRTTLEDRLRAKFAIGDASNQSTPATSSRASPAPVSAADHPLALPSSGSSTSDIPIVKGPPNPLSPTSTPLPDSPMVSPTPVHAQSMIATAANISVASLPGPLSEPSESGAETAEPPAIDAETDVPEATPTPEVAGPPAVSADDVQEDSSEHSPPEEVSDAPPASATTESPEPVEITPEVTEPIEVPNEESAAEAVPAPLPLPEVSQEVAPTIEDAPVNQQPEPEVEPESLPAAVELVEPSPEPQPVIVEDTAPSSDVSPLVALASPALLDADASLPRRSLDIPSRATTPDVEGSADVEALQKRLTLVQQRFADVSTSFKRLQAEKLAADRVLRELTSVESVTEVDALRDFLQNLTLKNEMAQDEIRRLSGKLTRQDERIEELRDIHRLESKSQSDQIDKLKAQVEEAEKLLKAAQSTTAQIEQESAKRKAEIDRLHGEVERATGSAKDEEEKRTKAITLLKTVRQKLVKSEKERDDAVKEVGTVREAEKAEREKERAERARLQGEIEKANAERETAVQGLRAQFDKEVAGLRDKHEKEIAALRGQFELEAITTKTTHVREIENKKNRISDLESRVKTLSEEKDELFDQLQLRQAELESSQSALESLQGQNTELQYQLREANDRAALMQDEFSDVRREQDVRTLSPGPSAEEVARLLASAESKYESKMSDLRRRLAEAERERDEADARWSRKFAERAKEVDELTAAIRSSQQSKEEDTEGRQALQAQVEALQAEIRAYQQQIADLHTELEKAAELEVSAKTELAEVASKTADLQQHVDESKNREAQLRAQNKTLREELRKVQSSVALLEKQRNPGVGYWASRNESTSELRSPRSSVSDLARETPSRPSTPTATKSDEEVNFEYLRNIIMQFLEHKEMRPHLVRILSTILHFTPQETRRLISKV